MINAKRFYLQKYLGNHSSFDPIKDFQQWSFQFQLLVTLLRPHSSVLFVICSVLVISRIPADLGASEWQPPSFLTTSFLWSHDLSPYVIRYCTHLTSHLSLILFRKTRLNQVAHLTLFIKVHNSNII